MKFPILKRKINGKRLVYLDNSATTQKTEAVIKAITNFYENYNSNIHRSVYTISEEATLAYEETRQKVATFINAHQEEIIFTSGTTQGCNFLAYALTENLQEGDEIILSEMEHHSNLLPWQELAKRKKLSVKYVKVKDYQLDLENLKTLLTKKTKIVSLTHVSNVLGTINPIKRIAKIVHENKSVLVVDAAQSVPHFKVDVQDLDCDFLVFSGHKMLGPTGVGVLYGKKELLKKLNPVFFGGGMVEKVNLKEAEWTDLPLRLEAGTPNVAGVIGLGVAIDTINKIGLDKIYAHEKQLTSYTLNELKKIKGIKIYGPKQERIGVISFDIKGIHPHDLASLVSQEGVAIRAGTHCTMPLMKTLGVQGLSRVSLYLYNTKEDIDLLIKAIKKAQKVLKC